MTHVVYRDDKGPEERIRDRLRPVNPNTYAYPFSPDASLVTGDGPTRCASQCMYGGSQTQHGGVTNPVYRGMGASTQGTHDDNESDDDY